MAIAPVSVNNPVDDSSITVLNGNMLGDGDWYIINDIDPATIHLYKEDGVWDIVDANNTNTSYIITIDDAYASTHTYRISNIYDGSGYEIYNGTHGQFIISDDESFSFSL